MTTPDLIVVGIWGTLVSLFLIHSIFEYQSKNIYVDEIAKEDTIARDIGTDEERIIGCSRLYKRTYKNGKVTFYEKKYTYKL